MFGKTALRVSDAVDPDRWQGVGAGARMDKVGQRPLGLFQAAAAQRAHQRLQRGGFLRASDRVAGGEQPVQFVLGERAAEPAQQQKRGSRQSDLAQRDAERELEERRAGGAGQLEKGSLDLASAWPVACILRYDEEPGAGIGVELVLAPLDAGVEF